MLCRRVEKFRYVILSETTAEEVLDELGFGKQDCAKTYEKDKKFGFFDSSGIHYGFEGFTDCNRPFGEYVILDIPNDRDWDTVEFYTEEDFFDRFEQC